MEEVWKPIKGYEDRYEVSNLGKVKSLSRKKGWCIAKEKIIIPCTSRTGYFVVDLYKNYSRKHHQIHRLVAQAFIPNPDNKPQVNHLDGDRKNNSVDNLEWSTAKENQLHKVYTLGSKSGKDIKKILCVETGEMYKSVHQAASALGKDSSFSIIAESARGKRPRALGYHWRYI